MGCFALTMLMCGRADVWSGLMCGPAASLPQTEVTLPIRELEFSGDLFTTSAGYGPPQAAADELVASLLGVVSGLDASRC